MGPSPRAATAPPVEGASGAAEPPPELSGGQALLGHLREFQREPVEMLLRAQRELGDLVRFRLGPREFVLFCGPEAHDAYFRAPEEQLSAKDVYQFTVPIFGRGVAYDVSTEIMDEQLGFLFPALRESRMETFPPVMFDETRRFADELGDEGEFDLPRAMNSLTVKIASRCLIGQEVRDCVDEGFADAYHDLQNGINTLGFFFPRLPTSAHRSRDRARRQIADLLGRIMAERRSTGTAPEDFMQTLMDARYKDGRPLSDEEIAGILLTVLFAGQHTSAVLATWTGVELARAPRYVDRIRAELADVYGDAGALSLEGLARQAALENAVRECERLHPPLILLIRKVLKPMRYGDHVVPARAMAMVSPAASHRLPGVFAAPDSFDPDRFAPPASEDRRHVYALIGFGGGKHRCMGKRFAYLQLKAIWAVLLDRFDIELATPRPAPHYGSWVTGPTEPCRLRYRRRSLPGVLR